MTGPGESATAARAVAGAAGVLATVVQDTHRAIARRHPVLRLLPRPIRATQEAATSAIYLAVRGGIAAAGAVTAAVLDTAPRTRDARPWSGSVRGRRLAGMIDGAFGSHLDAVRYPGLSMPMSLRGQGTDIAVEVAALAGHHPAATGALLVLAHGLIETEEWWDRATGDDLGVRLGRELGTTCVRVRYNSGQPVASSGAELDAVLDRLVAAWPVPVASIALVGHSMGGLVARSALRHAADHGHDWPRHVRHLVCLGTPHQGSPVERGAHAVARLLAGFDQTAPLAALLDLRSAGIKDLRTGWTGPDAAPSTLRRGNIAATISRDPTSLLGRTLGDLLVQPTSALPPAPPARSHAVGGLGHRDLLVDDRVHAVVRDWLRE